MALAFSTSLRILETVDSPNGFVTLIFKKPFVLMQPLSASLPAFKERKADSPVSAEVSTAASPSITTPSSGIFSPVFTTIISSIFTSVGETFFKPSAVARFA